MTDGELFDLDEVVRFGWPWHGTWRNDLLHLPNGATMTLPGAVPTMGDALAVMIPERAPVTTSPSDAAAGLTWLNYAVIYGVNHVLYGKALGPGKWIHIAEDLSPWIASAVIDKNGTGTLTLTGIDEPAIVQTIAIDCGNAAGTAYPDTIVAFEDAARTGRRAVFAWRWPDFMNQTPDPYAPWEAAWRYTRGRAFAHAELVIAGTPPAAVATFTLQVIRGEASHYAVVTDTVDFQENYEYNENNEPVLVSVTGGGVFERTEVVAMTYDGDDALQKVIKRWRSTTTDYAKTQSPGGWAYAGQREIRRRLEIGALAGAWMISDYAWSGNNPVAQLVTAGGWEQFGDDCMVYGNKAFGLYEVSESNGWRFSHPMTWAVAPGGYVTTGTAYPPYAAVDPMTGGVTVYQENAVVV